MTFTKVLHCAEFTELILRFGSFADVVKTMKCSRELAQHVKRKNVLWKKMHHFTQLIEQTGEIGHAATDKSKNKWRLIERFTMLHHPVGLNCHWTIRSDYKNTQEFKSIPNFDVFRDDLQRLVSRVSQYSSQTTTLDKERWTRFQMHKLAKHAFPSFDYARCCYCRFIVPNSYYADILEDVVVDDMRMICTKCYSS